MSTNLLSFIVKRILPFLLSIIVCSFTASAQTTLTVGDIVIIGIKESGGDRLKLLTMVDLTCGTKFIVSDNQWNNTTDSWPCNSSDSEYGAELTVTSKVCAGSVILIDDDGDNNFSVASSSGSLSIHDLSGGWGTNSGFNDGGDNSFVLQGTRTSPSFIYGLKNSGNWGNGDCDEVDDTALPDALTDGTNALHFSGGTGARHYNCTKGTSGTKAALLALISNTSNWTTSGITWTTASCAFSVTSPCNAPTHKATSFASSSITQTSATISWSNCTVNPGNTKVLVIARAGAAVATDPSSGSTYTVSSVYGSGAAIGAGFVVYDGIGTSVNLTGLSGGTTYHFSIYEYSCTGNCYNTDDLPGSITTPAPLPVDLIYFHTEKENSTIIHFEWATTSEKNNARFEIESSTDGLHFHTIGSLASKGNSREYQQYHFSWRAEEDAAYFRLKQIDLNGQTQYSSVEKIITEESIVYEIFPVPASEELFIKTSVSSTTRFTLLDLLGKEIFTGTVANRELYRLDVKFLPTGTYVLLFTMDNQSSWKKFYKE